MNFERIKITGASDQDRKEALQEVRSSSERILHESIDASNEEILELLEQYIPIAIQGIQELVDQLEINIDVYRELSQVQFRSEQTNRHRSDGAAGYSFPGDIINFAAKRFDVSDPDTLMHQLVHELWHALSGVKLHKISQDDGSVRRISTFGFSSESSTDFPDGMRQTLGYLNGFNEGVTQSLCFHTLNTIEPGLGNRGYLAYIPQTNIVNAVISGIAKKSGEPYGKKFLQHYLNKDLLFLKDIHKYYGDQGVHLIKLVADQIDSSEEVAMHELIEQFFDPETSTDVLDDLFNEIIKLEKQVTEHKNKNASLGMTYTATPYTKISKDRA